MSAKFSIFDRQLPTVWLPLHIIFNIRKVDKRSHRKLHFFFLDPTINSWWRAILESDLIAHSIPFQMTFHVLIRQEEVAVEGETGKVYRANFHDREGRSVLILRPAMQVPGWISDEYDCIFCHFYCSLGVLCWILQNTESLDNNIRHLVYLIENAILNLPEGQEQMSWLIDFTGWSLSTSVPIKSAKDTVNILQNHYPERLAMAFLYNPPRIFEAFWKVWVLRIFCFWYE